MPVRTKCPGCGHMTLRISWSQLRVHEECKQKSHLQRSGSKNRIADKRMFFPGTVTDRVVRDWLVNDPLDHIGEMPSMVDAIIDRERENETVVFKSKSDRAEILADCQEAVTNIEPDLLRYVVPFEYQADVRFVAPLQMRRPDGTLDVVHLIGAMDIMVRYETPTEKKFFVWDVKHTRDNGYWRKTVAQLTFYDLAVELMEGQRASVVGLLQPLCDERMKKFRPDDDSRMQMLQRIQGMATDIWNEDRAPKVDNAGCSFCDVKHACTRFQPVQIGKNRRLAF